MSRFAPSKRRTRRAGAAAVELAVLLPLLGFLCVIAVDFARIFYYSQTIANCARNGALYESDSYVRDESRYASLEDAALADAANLNDPANQPTVAKSSGVDATGQSYVEVTVGYKFKTVSKYVGVPAVVDLERKVRVAVAPPNPKTN